MPGRRTSDAIFAILATSLALGAALAHALELPNKISLSRDDYFIVQQIYAGWNRLGIVILMQLLALIAIVAAHRRDPSVRTAALLSLAFVTAAQVVFWIWTFPANQATANWTEKPADWERLRLQWEYSHLAGAAFQLAAMLALSVALLRRPPLHLE